LTQRSGYLPKEGDERLLTNQHAVLKPQNLIDVPEVGRINIFDDSGVPDALDVIKSLRLMANDVADARQPDDGRIDIPVAGQADAGQPDAGQPDAGQPDAGQPDIGQPNTGQPDAGRISTLLAESYRADPFPTRILGLLRNGARQCKEISLAECKEQDGQLLYRDCVYVPDHPPLRLQLLQDHHDPPAMGHPGRAKTLELLTRKYFWL